MAAQNTVKVLFSGAIKGGYGEAFKKVEAAHKKVNAAALFCVGPFFGAGDPAAEPDEWMVSVATGEFDVPVSTYFIGGFGRGCKDILEALPASDSKLKYLGRSGVTKIAGLTVAYLDGTYNAAAFESTDNDIHSPYFRQAEVEQLKRALSTLEGEVDILMTCEWPKSITQELDSENLDKTAAQPGSTIIDEIATLARPRYHFAGCLDTHFARLPYTNKDLGAGPRVTRFIGLAHTDNANKAKSLHALGLVPATDMDPDALAAIPPDSTASPYESAQRGVKRAAEQDLPEGQDWRWNMKGRGGRGRGRGEGEGGRGGPRERPAPILGRTDIAKDPICTITARNVPFRATEAEIVHFFSQAGKVLDVIRGANAEGKLNTFLTVQYDCKESADKALQLHNSDFQGRQITVEPATARSGRKPLGGAGQAVEGCWFCLGSSEVDLNLVASVGEDMYLAIDKGAITDDHVLLVSVDHYSNSATLSAPCYAEMERYLSALRSFYAGMGKELVAFERFLTLRKSGGNHCHVNVIGISPEAAKKAGQVFHRRAEAAGFKLTAMAPSSSHVLGGPAGNQAALQAVVGESEYFLAILPDGSRLVRPILRGERLPMDLGRQVLAELAGCPDRADWKKCSISQEEEEKRTEKFKAAFKPYDIMG